MAELRQVVELSDGEYEVKLEELAFWLNLPVTREFQKRLFKAFDHQSAIMSMAAGLSVDNLKGRAEVLQFVAEPRLLFEE